jgi:hypothetical protein
MEPAPTHRLAVTARFEMAGGVGLPAQSRVSHLLLSARVGCHTPVFLLLETRTNAAVAHPKSSTQGQAIASRMSMHLLPA